ncbi:MAG: MFS transporter [Alphaproteobacteria bacterium]|nr:MFS transporter [Alphaproteobacteria bacterium]
MAYFSNKEINLLNIHYGLKEMGWQMCSAFTLAYLYKQGLSLSNVFFIYAITLFTRTLTRPISLYFCTNKGVHWTLILGSFMFSLRYPAMLLVDGVGLKLIPFILISGLADVLYWVPYHNYFAQVGTSNDRGKSVGTREAISTIVSVLGPLLGGIFLAVNKYVAFTIPFALAIIGIIPLLKTHEISLPNIPTKEERKQIDSFGFKVFIGDGFFYQAGSIWSLIVFMLLNDSYNNFGYIMALAAVFRAVGSILFGGLIDKGNGKLICIIGYGIQIVIIGIRGFFAYSIPVVVACDFFYSIAFCFSMTGLMTAVYNATKGASYPIYFTYYTELGWDVGAVLSMVFIGIMTYFGINVRFGLIWSVVGAIISVVCLCKYYDRKSDKDKHHSELKHLPQRNMTQEFKAS